jgi:putative membrane protein
MQNLNDDARVRDHLANERTYLAWLRTGMAMMGFGVVIAKLRYLFLPEASTPPTASIVHVSNIGFLFAVIGLLIIMIAGCRYVVVQNQIRQKSYKSSKRTVVTLSIIVIALGVLIVWYLSQGADLFAASR